MVGATEPVRSRPDDGVTGVGGLARVGCRSAAALEEEEAERPDGDRRGRGVDAWHVEPPVAVSNSFGPTFDHSSSALHA